MSLHFPDFGTFVGQDRYGLFIFELPVRGFDERMNREMVEVRLGCNDSWEWAAVLTNYRCPTWEEMDEVKGAIWDEEDCVMQLHPPESEYVNIHQYTLWLWRPLKVSIPRPPFGCNSPRLGADNT